eukprot:scaffold421_cov125-Isochrysis_galbana.AAC.12
MSVAPQSSTRHPPTPRPATRRRYRLKAMRSEAAALYPQQKKRALERLSDDRMRHARKAGICSLLASRPRIPPVLGRCHSPSSGTLD